MTTMQRDALVDDYLRRLEAAASGLPRERRRELVAEIAEHIEAALEGGPRDEASVRNVLERLGPPEEIAAAEQPVRPGRGRLETAALVVLALSFLVPGLGYVAGAAMVIVSDAWTGRDKVLGLLIPPLVFVFGGLVVGLGAASGDSTGALGPIELAIVVANVLSGLGASAYLGRRLPR
jgi:uncharacterized membrane protein